MSHRLASPVALLLALVLGACAPGGGGKSSPAPEVGLEARVQVTNNNWSNVQVYLERSGMMQQLGTVSGMSARSFRVPKAFLAQAEVRLMADPIGVGGQPVIVPVQIEPGQRLEFKIEQHLAVSAVFVR